MLYLDLKKKIHFDKKLKKLCLVRYEADFKVNNAIFQRVFLKTACRTEK